MYVLLGFSVIFYYFAGIVNLAVLFGVSLLNYILARFVQNKAAYIVGLVLNIACLSLFKYSRNLLLPLGMSFYVFNSISYLTDVRRKKTEYERNIFRYLTYSMMFPTVSMGPLSRYGDIRKSFVSLGCDDMEVFAGGLRRFLSGLFKKCVIADGLGLLFEQIKGTSDMSALMCVFSLAVFGIQLYCDFSGYCDMAIGIGNMIGIKYSENFDHPYLSKSISEFWHRWHMTLNRFFTDYVYIPMGGNRVPVLRHIINIMTVWILTGIWHGSTLNFLLWGVYYGVILVMEKYLFKGILEKMPGILRHVYVLVIVLFGYVFFSAGNMKEAMLTLNRLFSGPLCSHSLLFFLRENAVLLVCGILFCVKMPEKIQNTLDRYPVIKDAAVIAMYVLSVSYILSGNYRPFLYGGF